MGLRLTTEDDQVAMFDSVTGWAFGPVFANAHEAAVFLDWLDVHHDVSDARALPLARLEELYGEYLQEDRPGLVTGWGTHRAEALRIVTDGWQSDDLVAALAPVIDEIRRDERKPADS